MQIFATLLIVSGVGLLIWTLSAELRGGAATATSTESRSAQLRIPALRRQRLQPQEQDHATDERRPGGRPQPAPSRGRKVRFETAHELTASFEPDPASGGGLAVDPAPKPSRLLAIVQIALLLALLAVAVAVGLFGAGSLITKAVSHLFSSTSPTPGG